MIDIFWFQLKKPAQYIDNFNTEEEIREICEDEDSAVVFDDNL